MAINKKKIEEVSASTDIVLGSSDLVDDAALGREIRNILKAGSGILITEDSSGNVTISTEDVAELDKKFQSTMVNPDDKSDYPLLWTNYPTGSGTARHLAPNGSKNGYVYCTDNMFHIFYNASEYLFYDQYSKFSFRIPYGLVYWYHDYNQLVAPIACNYDMKVLFLGRKGNANYAGNLCLWDYKTKQLAYQFNTPRRTSGNTTSGPITDPQVNPYKQIRISVNDKTGHFIILGKIAKSYESWNEDQTAIIVNYEWRKVGYWIFDPEKLKFIKWNSETQSYDEFDECFTEEGMTELSHFVTDNIDNSYSWDMVMYRISTRYHYIDGVRTGSPWKVDQSSADLNRILDRDHFMGINVDTWLLYATDDWSSEHQEDGTTTYTSYDGVWLFDEHDEIYPLSNEVQVTQYSDWGGKIRLDTHLVIPITLHNLNKPYRIAAVYSANLGDVELRTNSGIVISNREYMFTIQKLINWNNMTYSYEVYPFGELHSTAYMNNLMLNYNSISNTHFVGNNRGGYGGSRSHFWYSGGSVIKMNTNIRLEFPFEMLGSDTLELMNSGLCVSRIDDSRIINSYWFVGGYNAPYRGAICIFL